MMCNTTWLILAVLCSYVGVNFRDKFLCNWQPTVRKQNAFGFFQCHTPFGRKPAPLHSFIDRLIYKFKLFFTPWKTDVVRDKPTFLCCQNINESLMLSTLYYVLCEKSDPNPVFLQHSPESIFSSRCLSPQITTGTISG